VKNINATGMKKNNVRKIISYISSFFRKSAEKSVSCGSWEIGMNQVNCTNDATADINQINTTTRMHLGFVTSDEYRRGWMTARYLE